MGEWRDRWVRWKIEFGWKWRAFVERWRALPLTTRAGIAAGLMAIAAVGLTLSIWSFTARSRIGGEVPSGAVVLYTSLDSFLLQPILDEFEKETGIKVQAVGDTEATKTTGLVERLITEKDAPRADVWWSNEALGTAVLEARGVIAQFAAKAEADFPGGWPEEFRSKDRRWYGDAIRSRVIAYNTARFPSGGAPTRLRELLKPEFQGRIGMARPQFGTTRAFVASLVFVHGPAGARRYLAALKENGLRLYDGNSAVVRAISVGEIDVGLTDSDDVAAAKRNTWPVEMSYESVDKPATRLGEDDLRSVGPLLIPCTVAVVRAGPHPNEALRLANFLLSAKVERMLAEGDAKHMPLRESLAKELKMEPPKDAMPAPARDAAGVLPAADKIIDELFGSH